MKVLVSCSQFKAHYRVVGDFWFRPPGRVTFSCLAVQIGHIGDRCAWTCLTPSVEPYRAHMPWKTKDTMSLREEFVLLAQQEGANRRELCRRFGISPQTAYKWLARHEQHGREGLRDRSRRPATSPHLTPMEQESAVIAFRLQHPCWGGRKLSRRLQDLGHPSLAPSTITNILHRHGLIDSQASEAAQAWQRFEHAAPNDLWQMDFKGYFQASEGACHPLTVLDDHSRFSLGIRPVRSSATGLSRNSYTPSSSAMSARADQC